MRKYLLLIILAIFPVVAFADIKLVSGDLDTVGSTIKIGDDIFYIIGKEDDTHIKIMSKFNIGIGNMFEENPIYKQTIFAMGAVDGNTPTSGAVCNGSSGYNFPGPTTQIVIDGLREYTNYVQNEGVIVTNTDIIDYNLLKELSGNANNTFTSALNREFLYLTSYWVNTGGSSYGRFNNLGGNIGQIGYGYCPQYYGIRPVFTIEVNGDLERDSTNGPIIKPKLSGSQYNLGDIYKLGDEEFYIIGKEDSKHLKLLAKYNLGAGAGYATRTNKQEADAIGWVEGSDTHNGSMSFSDRAYWANSRSIETALKAKYGTTFPAYILDKLSDAKEVIGKYVNSLKDQGYKVTGRLIKQEELNGLGCNSNTMTCTDAPEWIYSTSYWTGSAANPHFLNYVNTSGRFGEDRYARSDRYGIRPVILLRIDEEEIEDVPENRDDPDVPVNPSDETEDDEEDDDESGIVKAVRKILSNPKTGVFSISLLLVALIAISVFVYTKVFKKSLFKKY